MNIGSCVYTQRLFTNIEKNDDLLFKSLRVKLFSLTSHTKLYHNLFWLMICLKFRIQYILLKYSLKSHEKSACINLTSLTVSVTSWNRINEVWLCGVFFLFNSDHLLNIRDLYIVWRSSTAYAYHNFYCVLIKKFIKWHMFSVGHLNTIQSILELNGILNWIVPRT